MNYKAKVFLFIGSVFTLGLLIYQWYASSPSTLQNKTPQGILVEGVRGKLGTITRRITTNGNLVANQSVTLMSEVEGKIVEIPFKQGGQVAKGAVLIKIDEALYKIQVQEAEAKVQLAKSKYHRADTLFKKNFGTSASRDEALANLKVSEAELASAKLRLSQTQIQAPFEGVAGLRSVSVGTFVAKNQELLTLVDLTPIYVDFSVPESYGKNLHTGQEIDAVVEGFDSLPVTGEIIAIDPKADQGTHSIQVRAELKNEDGHLKPGQFVRVTVELGKEDDVVLIPQVAVERDGDQEYVFLISDGVAVRTEVTTGQKEAEMVQILDGVKEGDWVVTVGQIKIQDGYPVRLAGEPHESKKGERPSLLKSSPSSQKKESSSRFFLNPNPEKDKMAMLEFPKIGGAASKIEAQASGQDL